MSVISTVISKWWTAHATDSLITELLADGSRNPIEWERSKIVPVRRWRGAMSYWGLAKCDAFGWSTFDWLQNQVAASDEFGSPEEFAKAIASNLNQQLTQVSFANPTDSGIGIHFTAYEQVGDYWIPELFLISNWTDPTYSAVSEHGVRWSRETYHTIVNSPPEPSHGGPHYRMCVHTFLQDSGIFIYNNGFPALFNAAAKGTLQIFRAIASMGQLADAESPRTYLAIARRPIEVVAKLQTDFCRQGTRRVGGRLHDLAITQTGETFSTTGDA